MGEMTVEELHYWWHAGLQPAECLIYFWLPQPCLNQLSFSFILLNLYALRIVKTSKRKITIYDIRLYSIDEIDLTLSV